METVLFGKNMESFFYFYLLLNNEPNTIKLSSNKEIISEVESPRNRSSPRLLKVANVNSW